MRTNAIKIMVKGWVKVLPFYLFTLLPLLISCSESDGTEEEFVDWRSKNEAYFEQQYALHSGSGIVRKWSLDETSSGVQHTDCILVDVLEEGRGETSPLYTDSVEVHYIGKLLPSTSYAGGYVFDKSYSTYDPEVSVPKTFVVNALISGFSTALQHMHRGDHWRVTVPYQLGYGASGSGSIPGYSTLIFEIRLVDFWSKEKGDRK